MNIEIIGGGTVFHVRNHLALSVPAYGTTARILNSYCKLFQDELETHLHLTKMATQGQSDLETNEDISKLVDKLIANPNTKIIFFNPALVDYEGFIYRSGHVGYEWSDCIPTDSGKYETRLVTSKGDQEMLLRPASKVISKIRKERKDIFLVAFKTTCGATEDEQFLTGLHLLKSNSCNLVLANDTKTRVNMIITPEQARYHVSTDRDMVLKNLVDMAISRSKGTFTRSKVVTGRGVPWTHDLVPSSLRTVVDYCIMAGAYKPFQGSTVGHFAVKLDDNKFLTSMRKSNFNQLEELALVHAVGNDEVWSQGGKPSVGGQSQRIVFKDHPEMNCIVHFHCPPKYPAQLSVRDQAPYECGSHECGNNTSKGLREEVPGIKCVYLDHHGPNIVFNSKIDPSVVIDFIDKNFDLSKSTDEVDRTKVKVV
jgi:Ribulose-5-phosphate 4-epimerase and related epimerases and aldolases